jgi:hypothetical protein
LLLIYNINAITRHLYTSLLGCLTGLRCDQAMKTTLITALALILLLSSSCSAVTGKEPNNFCQDVASWQQWHELLEKHPQDDATHALYATRRSLYSMVESGQIEMDRAIRISEYMRESMIDRYREQKGAEQARGKGNVIDCKLRYLLRCNNRLP